MSLIITNYKLFRLLNNKTTLNQAYSEHKHSLTICIQRYIVIAMKPVGARVSLL